MDIKELRIGNYIYVKKIHSDFDIKPGVNCIDEELFLQILMYQTVRKALMRIPITEEILPMFGFYEKDGDFLIDYLCKKYNVIKSLTFTFTDTDHFYLIDSNGCITGRNIRYIHKLQNICYDFGKELEFNIPHSVNGTDFDPGEIGMTFKES